MVIKINTKTEIMWILVALYLLKTYLLQPELFFLVCVFTIGVYTIRKKTIVIPHIPGIMIYITALIIATVIGMVKYPAILIERDIFYEFFSVIYIFIGYYCFDYYKDRKKSLWKTACLILFITSCVCLAKGMTSVSSGADFSTFRQNFAQGVDSISFMIPILIGKKYIFKENTFSAFKDNVLIIIWITQVLLNLSRISIINIILGLVVFIICGAYRHILNFKNSFRVIALVTVLVLAGVAFVNVMPDNATSRFTEKFSNSLTEISSENEYDSISSAQSDWRGYEINCAKEQWSKSSIFEQLFGEGNGTLISIHYIPDQWKDTVEIQNSKFGVTILHNTYYTLLIKGGLFAVIAFIAFILLNIRKSIKMLKNGSGENLLYATIMILLLLTITLDAYVIRTMMDKGSEMIALLLIGWINAKFNNLGRENTTYDEKN